MTVPYISTMARSVGSKLRGIASDFPSKVREPYSYIAIAAAIGFGATPLNPANAETPLLLQQFDEFGKKISVYRWLEDYSYLGKLDRPLEGLEKFKYIPFGENSYLSLGGEYRIRFEGVDEPLYGLAHIDDFNSLNHRVYLHADLHLGNRVRVFSQLATAYEDGREPGPRPFDETDPDVQQLFVDVKFGKPGGPRGMVRVGRQELPLGAYPFRISAPRLSTNIRRSFDAVKVVAMPTDKIRFQAFYAKPLLNSPGSFDDSRDSTEEFWAAYLTTPAPLIKGAKMDWYYLGRSEEDEEYNQGIADETRHSLGVRLFGNKEKFTYNMEAIYQFGSFGEGNINAWAVASDFSHDINGILPIPTKLGISLNASSGDKDPDDENLQTFNALYPNLIYFSEAVTFSPTNAYSIYPYIDVRPHKNLRLYLGSNILWRQRETDAIYRPVYVPLVRPEQTDSRFVGQLAQAQLYWWPFGGGSHQFSGNLQVRAIYVRGTSGGVISDAGGTNTDFGMIELYFRL